MVISVLLKQVITNSTIAPVDTETSDSLGVADANTMFDCLNNSILGGLKTTLQFIIPYEWNFRTQVLSERLHHVSKLSKFDS